ncbi:hypothetical protein [Glutamicibacter arilaitensis]|uniref:hypothetical protein n=1 Tax=Glutamicibacter arilaitensis TaxID=256701 RepID=UPI00384AD601
MDPLGTLSRENLTIAIWVVVAIFAVAMGIWRRKQLQWVLLSSVLLFAVLNVGVGIYVLSNVGDSRWAAEGSVPLQAPSLTETPIVGQYLDPLDSAIQSMVGGVNSFLAFNQALPVSLDYFAKSGWALLIAVPLLIIVAAMSYTAARRRKRELSDYRATVDQLKIDLEQIKQQIAAGNAPRAEEPESAPRSPMSHRDI